MLGGIGATYLHIELVAAIATTDDDGAADEGAEGFEDFLAGFAGCRCCTLNLLENEILDWHLSADFSIVNC